MQGKVSFCVRLFLKGASLYFCGNSLRGSRVKVGETSTWTSAVDLFTYIFLPVLGSSSVLHCWNGEMGGTTRLILDKGEYTRASIKLDSSSSDFRGIKHIYKKLSIHHPPVQSLLIMPFPFSPIPRYAFHY